MRTGFIGIGNMGGAILYGYAASEASDGNDIAVFNRSEGRSLKAKERFPKISICRNSGELSRMSDIIIIGVRAQGIDDVLEEVKIKGELIRDYIEGMHSPYVAGVRGLGLMIGVQLTGISHKELAQRCIDRGLLVLTAGTDTLRLLPPLTITREEILRGLDILHSVLCE